MKPFKSSNWKNLLSRWLNGRITAREEQELDRHAQDDPFLADALEGFRQHPEGEHAEQVAKLRMRFLREQKRSSFSVWRIAAAVALLIVAGVSLWQVSVKPEQELAQMETVPDDRSSEAIERNSPPPSYDEAPAKTAEPDNRRPQSPPTDQLAFEVKPSTPPASNPVPRKASDAPALPGEAVTREAPSGLAPTTTGKEKATPAPELSEIIVADQPAPEKIEAEEEVIAPTLKKETAEGLLAQKSIAPPSNAPARTRSINTGEMYVVQSEVLAKRRRDQNISGTVTSNNGMPLPGATIRLPGTTHSVVTDQDGRFSLSAPANTEQLQLVYQDQNRLFTVGEQDSFRLNPYFEVSDAVLAQQESIQPRRMEKQNAKLLPDAYAFNQLLPHPSIDSTAYRRYITDNLRYPEAAKAAGVSGTVTLQFSFDQEGKPFNFLLLKSLGYGCEEEAMRLLREGPPWIAPDYSIATYSIRFDP